MQKHFTFFINTLYTLLSEPEESSHGSISLKIKEEEEPKQAESADSLIVPSESSVSEAQEDDLSFSVSPIRQKNSNSSRQSFLNSKDSHESDNERFKLSPMGEYPRESIESEVVNGENLMLDIFSNGGRSNLDFSRSAHQ